MAEGIHKNAVGAQQKKPFEQLIFQWNSEEWPDMLRESVLKCGITITKICFYKPDIFSICNWTVITKYLFLYFLLRGISVSGILEGKEKRQSLILCKFAKIVIVIHFHPSLS